MVLKYPTVETYSAVLSGARAEPLMLGLIGTKFTSWCGLQNGVIFKGCAPPYSMLLGRRLSCTQPLIQHFTKF